MESKELIKQLIVLDTKVFPEKPFTQNTFRYYLKKLTNKPFIYYHTEDNLDTKIISYCLITYTKNKARIYSVAVDPEYQGQGLARALITSAINCSTKSLVTLECKPDLFLFYSKLGFEKYGEIPDYYADGVHALKMRIRI